MRDLAAGPRRFVELQRVLPGISTEQLRSRLNRMVADGMLTRKRYREVPPRVDYELTERARELMPILGELARWGYEWAWSPPRESRVGRPRRDLPARPRARQLRRRPRHDRVRGRGRRRALLLLVHGLRDRGRARGARGDRTPTPAWPATRPRGFGRSPPSVIGAGSRSRATAARRRAAGRPAGRQRPAAARSLRGRVATPHAAAAAATRRAARLLLRIRRGAGSPAPVLRAAGQHRLHPARPGCRWPGAGLAVDGCDPSPGAPVFLQSHDGRPQSPG